MNIKESRSAVSVTLGAQIINRDCFVQIFLPSRDQESRTLEDHALWVERAEKLFSMLFGGATREPDAEGVWKNPETSLIVRERTARLTAYTSEITLFESSGKIREFLHAFGRLTNQGEVGVNINNIFLGITEFDPLDASTE